MKRAPRRAGARYADWTTALFLGEDALLSPENNQLGVKVIHFHMAQVCLFIALCVAPLTAPCVTRS